MLKTSAWDVPPPGAGLVTVTRAVPGTAISDAEMAAVSWVELTNAVVRMLPFQFTTELLTKFVPFTTRLNAGSPAVAFAGVVEVNVGRGFDGSGFLPPQPSLKATDNTTPSTTIAIPEYLHPEVTAFESTRPPWSGDLSQIPAKTKQLRNCHKTPLRSPILFPSAYPDQPLLQHAEVRKKMYTAARIYCF